MQIVLLFFCQIYNPKQWDTHILHYDDITCWVEKSYIGSSILRHAGAETGLEKLKRKQI